MSYTLWSKGRLVGHTELDLRHVQECVRMGFIEPTEEGKPLLADASGVPAAAYALARAAERAANLRKTSLTEFADFQAACARREALQLELRDEVGSRFPCDWIQINDIQDPASLEGEIFDYDEPFETFETFEPFEPFDPELDAAIENDVEFAESHFDPHSFEAPDERWDTMKYHMMVYLRRRA